MTTPAGRITRYQTGDAGKLTGIIRVTNNSTGAGYETTISAIN